MLLAIEISDTEAKRLLELAAKGARPVSTTGTISIGPTMPEDRALLDGFRTECETARRRGRLREAS